MKNGISGVQSSYVCETSFGELQCYGKENNHSGKLCHKRKEYMLRITF